MPLRLEDYTIARLSGPTVAHLLRPTKKGLPIMFLFGDRHNGTTKQCKDCKCKGPNDPNCCLEVYSKTFLQLLDKLSAKKKISFYTEFFEPTEEKEMYQRKPAIFAEHIENRLATPPRGVMQFLREHLITCYLETPKSTPTSTRLHKYCPTQQIDWEYGDLRQLNTNAPISMLIQKEPYFYEALLFRILYLLYDYSEEILEKSSNTTKPRIGEKQKSSNPLLQDHFNPFEIEQKLGQRKAQAVWKSLRLLLTSPVEFAKYFVSESNPLRSHSMLHRLLTSKKFTTKDLEEWLTVELQYYTSQSKKLDDEVLREWASYFKKLEQQDTPKTPTRAPSDPLMLVDVTLCFLDVYYVLHAFTKTSHHLSVGYFGSTHIRGLVHLLVTHLKWYEEVSTPSRGTPQEERCLVLDKQEWSVD